MGDDGEWRLNSDTAMFKWFPGTKGDWIEDTPWCEKPPQPDSVKTETGREYSCHMLVVPQTTSLQGLYSES